MKKNKIIAPLLLTGVFALTSLVSCYHPDPTKDSDFDGLTDDIDPDPNNNKYQITLVKENEDEREETDKLTVTVDYRDFLTKGYSRNLSLLSSFFINAANSAYKPSVQNNIYPTFPTEESKICPILAQIGGEDITKIEIASDYEDVDPYDVANLFMAHHTFSYEDEDYQIYFVLIDPYVDNTGWISNFDLGGVDEDGFTDEYVKLEGDKHPDWLNHIEHKGFDVTANRLIEEIEDYQDEHNNSDAKQITLVTGHSRGGAISNLIAKSFVDDNKEVRAYCFNPANTTLASLEETQKIIYTSSIFNLINNADLVSRVPTLEWGFRLYGQYIRQDINHELFKSFLKKDYSHNTEAGINAMIGVLNNMCTKDSHCSRNNMYEFRDPNDDYPERWESDDKQEMDDLLEELDSYLPEGSYASKCFWHSEEVQGTGPYYIEYQTRPALIKALMEDVLAKENFEYILSYLKLLSRLINETLAAYLGLEDNDFSILGVINAHEQPIACVMAEQYQK